MFIHIYTLIKMLYILYSNKNVALSNISMYSTRKNVKCQTKTINLKYQLRYVMKNLTYLTDRALY